MMHPDGPSSAPPPDPGRRQFILKTCTVAVGGLSVLPPLAAGVAVALDPLRRVTAGDAAFVRVTNLEALPADGVPRKFTVLADRVDAWNKYPRSPVGAIYLRRPSDTVVSALQASCPHAGCLVDYVTSANHYFCPCHNSSFAVDGTIDNPASPAARPMDSLAVEIRGDQEVWVKFRNFRAGTSEKIPV